MPVFSFPLLTFTVILYVALCIPTSTVLAQHVAYLFYQEYFHYALS